MPPRPISTNTESRLPFTLTSPQAKGRVERANKTLQDRLVKELRLRNISTLEAANAYMPKFVEGFSAKFAKLPRNGKDVHRPSPRTTISVIRCV
jgi:hypothetical protein